jgi:hypothetical protein
LSDSATRTRTLKPFHKWLIQIECVLNLYPKSIAQDNLRMTEPNVVTSKFLLGAWRSQQKLEQLVRGGNAIDPPAKNDGYAFAQGEEGRELWLLFQKREVLIAAELDCCLR